MPSRKSPALDDQLGDLEPEQLRRLVAAIGGALNSGATLEATRKNSVRLSQDRATLLGVRVIRAKKRRAK